MVSDGLLWLFSLRDSCHIKVDVMFCSVGRAQGSPQSPEQDSA